MTTKPVVVDTNVLLVANGRHAAVSKECIATCSLRLNAIKKDGQISIDNKRRIINEYLKKTSPYQERKPPEQKGAGDAFLYWLLQNQTSKRVRQIEIKESEDGGFDAIQPSQQFAALKADQKFIAVALADEKRPAILQAADTKWIEHTEALHKRGVTVEFLCEQDIEKLKRSNRGRKKAK